MLGGFAIAWYLAEAMLAYEVRWHFSPRYVPLCMLRDLILPVLWLAAWAGDEFVWRDNVIRVADRAHAA